MPCLRMGESSFIASASAGSGDISAKSRPRGAAQNLMTVLPRSLRKCSMSRSHWVVKVPGVSFFM